MTKDELTDVAQNDTLIISLGESWLRRSIDNRLKRKYYSSQHMRQAGRFLLEMKKLSQGKINTISGCIKPENYDMATTAALNMAKPNMDNETDLAAPSNAIKFKFDLIRLTHCKIAFAIKRRIPASKAEADAFLQLINISWNEQVTRLARSVLNERQLNKAVNLPSPEDVKKLK